MYYYEVAPTRIIRASSAAFTYASNQLVNIGQLVIIPVGKQTHIGLVLKKVTKPTYDTRDIIELLPISPLPIPLIETTLWISKYYATHLAVVLQTILPKGIAKKRRKQKNALPPPTRDRTSFLLNKHQIEAVDNLKQMPPGTVVLHGVTGSGKTAVYIEYAKSIIANGQSVIVLVPEIALTSQLVSEFQQHFEDIILTHSRQTEAERHLAWLDALNSTTPRVAIGPRSALFLPLSSIGAIIIDEAHEPSFKQDQSPRYSALRVASILGSHHQSRVIQGSATPLVSEYYLALKMNKSIIHLPHPARQDTTPPNIAIVDMTKKTNFIQHRFFSDKLLQSLTDQLNAGKQSLIFHNRRGSASTTLCETCGWTGVCPRCYVPLTLHADLHRLQCHICAHKERVPTSCPICQSTEIIHKGIGTKLIESELKKIFPTARIARFDGDTDGTETVEYRYQSMYDGTIDIIIGTQVVAKGLDLPHLRTVGVIQADAGLSIPDYTSSERTFQLLAQVVGRVGRSRHNTSVIVQSYQPEAPAIRDGIRQDFDSFYQNTINERRRAKFPPFTYLLKLTCVYKTEAASIRNATSLAKVIRSKYTDMTIFGPTPSFYERQHGTYRWQIIIKSTDRNKLRYIIDNDLPSAHWQYDLDPMSLL